MSYLMPAAGSDRRLDLRVPVEMFLNQYVRDQPHRALAMNVSETGLYLQRLAEPLTRRSGIVALEFELPGSGETIWAKGEARFDNLGDDFHFTGVRFLAMARKHGRLVRDYVQDRHCRLQELQRLRTRLQRWARPTY